MLPSFISLNFFVLLVGELTFVNAVTDVTGFGFIGHLLEMLANTNCSAVIEKEQVPVINSAKEFASQFVFPDNTTRNYNYQIKQVDGLTNLDFIFYCDPQTSGGLLFSVNKESENEMDEFLKNNHQFFAKVGNVIEKKEKAILFM